jgi:uroporphyrinogen-III decarboxylase
VLWRIIGSENVMLWIGMYPDEIGRIVERINEFNLELTKAQIKAAGGLLDGMVIWATWLTAKICFLTGLLAQVLKPGVKAIVDECHSQGLPVIYHGCGNVRRILPISSRQVLTPTTAGGKAGSM